MEVPRAAIVEIWARVAISSERRRAPLRLVGQAGGCGDIDLLLMDHFLANWEAHSVRFEDTHPYLWRTLDGYEHRPQLVDHVHVGRTGGTFAIAGADDVLGGKKGGLPGVGFGRTAGGGGGINPDFGGGGGGLGGSSVPEPSAIALLGFGIVGVVLAVARNTKTATKRA
jgi:hypothetical protein